MSSSCGSSNWENKKSNPLESWNEACKDVVNLKVQEKNNAPKMLFLGLCKKGLVKGYPKGKYLKSNKTYQKIDQNIIPILKELIENKDRQVVVSFVTKDLNPISNQPKYIKEKAKKAIRDLNRVFANYKMKF